MNLTGGGAFYSQTPKSCLEDLGGIKGSFSKGAGAKHLRILKGDVILNEVKNRRNERIGLTQQFFEQSSQNDNKVLSPRERVRVRVQQSQEILRPSTEVLSAISTINTQNDKNRCHSGFDPQSQSLMQRMVCPFTLALFPWARELKSAFTLAEILITLGVVGIIAAMTLPMLAENYQRRIVETRLKKFYTTFNQAILRSVNDNGPFDGWGYFLNNKYDANGNQVFQYEIILNNFDLYLRPYLNIAQTQEVVYTNGGRCLLYYLHDGSAFHYNQYQNRDLKYYPKDPVRCLKQPAINREGVCSFGFEFYPVGAARNQSGWKYLDNKGLEPTMYDWNGSIEMLYNDPLRGCIPKNSNAVYCTAIIQYNGWHFPKDYPRKIRY